MSRQKTQEHDKEMPVDAIKLLKEQHREVEGIFAELEETGDRALKKRLQLVRKLVMSLEAHAWIEEKIFYPAGQEVDLDLTLEAVEEHSLIHFMLGKLVETDPSEETFLARVTVLKEIVQHHVEEEEGEYFPEVQKKLGKKRLAELGLELHDEFMSRTKKLQTAKDPSEMRANIPQETV